MFSLTDSQYEYGGCNAVHHEKMPFLSLILDIGLVAVLRQTFDSFPLPILSAGGSTGSTWFKTEIYCFL